MRVKRQGGDRRQFWQDLETAVDDRRGAVFIITALALSMMVMIIGFAADYGYAAYLNQRLARAADTAAISAVSQDAATAVGGYANTAALQQLGSAIYAENVKQLPITGVTTNTSAH